MILFVDDEPRYVRLFLEELKYAGLRYAYMRKVDDALDFVDENLADVSLLVLDIMMPPGRSFDSAQTRYGLDTGIRFYERVRRNSPALPVIILTNVTDEEAARRFRAQPFCWFLRKRDYLPYELEQTIRDILSKQGGDK